MEEAYARMGMGLPIDPNLRVDLRRHNKEQVIQLANYIGGPQILYVDNVVGYGLFAEKDYNGREFVTTYGGEVMGPNHGGSYAFDMGRRRGDAGRGVCL
jgi:hypothetical protein